ncbi:putative alpha-mannosyltransferase [Phaeomoniella chlamydospora]|uniref:Mannosyltransferase n=1 Tax=Phaeomoniella chlamydospora TaxID=158046 RepID=A0A0G2E4V1_PHACM|nr:putative alpha-mannosyltransferase [Phaeomoniella chlamydospora]
MPPKQIASTAPDRQRDVSQFRTKATTTPSAKPDPSQQGRTPGSSSHVSSQTAFLVCCLSHVVAALYAPIQDCDETFNYWEPTHYLTHGYGLQTWEYSPEYGIRSWLYVLLHAVPQKLASFAVKHKTAEFYLIRITLALVCAASEAKLVSVISRTLNPRIAILYLLVTFTPGMFYASVAYLPSSFAMICAIQGALALPFLAEEVIMAAITKDYFDTCRRFLDGTVRSLIVVGLELAINAFFYHEIVIAAWNIVFYNVFSSSDRGPNIFGVEPWDFYLKNLTLNFNIWFPLALLAAPLVFLLWCFRSHAPTQQTLLRTTIFISPFFFWLLIFNFQPHKEERFMYPAYPFLALNAAIAMHVILSVLGSANPRTLLGKLPSWLKLQIAFSVVLLSVAISSLRILGTITAYNAPLHVYRALEAEGMAKSGDTICLGKEWYRFPSSYFLPNGSHAKFVKSEFNGLLPGEFSEAKTGFGFFPGTWLIPPGMNDRNQEDPGKYVSLF